MCGRFTLRNPRRAKFDRPPVGGLFNLVPRYNIAPSQSVLAITEHNGEPKTSLYHWGLVPAWSSDLKGFINARAETLQEKPSFSESFQRRRCLIPADGFYEWKRVGKSKQPYYFQMKDEEPFAFAGIWDQWQGEDRLIVSCAIITTTPNELLASIHNLICTNSVKALEVQTGLTHLVSPELGQEFDLLGVLRDEVDD